MPRASYELLWRVLGNVCAWGMNKGWLITPLPLCCCNDYILQNFCCCSTWTISYVIECKKATCSSSNNITLQKWPLISRENLVQQRCFTRSGCAASRKPLCASFWQQLQRLRTSPLCFRVKWPTNARHSQGGWQIDVAPLLTAEMHIVFDHWVTANIPAKFPKLRRSAREIGRASCRERV